MTAVFAHRGCTEGFTENTIEAFAEARRLGADGVELDVRLTADGALAIHHDAEIPGIGTIDQLAVADLPAHVPLLADALAACEGMLVNVEIKNAPQDPGWDPDEAVAALTAAAIDSPPRSSWRSRRQSRRVLPPSTPSWRRQTWSSSSGRMQWDLRSTSGRSTPPTTCAPWWPPAWTP
jgi:glycerophosphoryl diester phosphodiesterase